jgi:hypothetical protein
MRLLGEVHRESNCAMQNEQENRKAKAKRAMTLLLSQGYDTPPSVIPMRNVVRAPL